MQAYCLIVMAYIMAGQTFWGTLEPITPATKYVLSKSVPTQKSAPNKTCAQQLKGVPKKSVPHSNGTHSQMGHKYPTP